MTKSFSDIAQNELFSTDTFPGVVWRKATLYAASVLWAGADADSIQYGAEYNFSLRSVCRPLTRKDLPPRPSPIYGFRWAYEGDRAEVFLHSATQMKVVEEITVSKDWPMTNRAVGYIVPWPEDPRFVPPVLTTAELTELPSSTVIEPRTRAWLLQDYITVFEQLNKCLADSIVPSLITKARDETDATPAQEIEAEEDQRFRTYMRQDLERNASSAVARVSGVGVSAPEPDVGYQDQYGDEDWL